MSTQVTYKGNTIANFTNDTKTLKTAGKYMEDDVTITEVIAGQGNVWQDEDGYVHLDDESGLDFQAKSVNPTESSQTVRPDAGYTALSQVTVGAISSTYVGTGIARKTSTDLTASGSTVTAPAGYYSSQATKNINGGQAFTPAVTITTNPTFSLVSSTGKLTAAYTGSSNITPTVTAGYIAAGTSGKVTTTGTSTYTLTTKAATTYNVSVADQTIASYRWLTGAQTIRAVTTSNLIAANIKSGVTVKVGDAGNASRITQISGTYAPTLISKTVTPTEDTQVITVDTFITTQTGYVDIVDGFSYSAINLQVGAAYSIHIIFEDQDTGAGTYDVWYDVVRDTTDYILAGRPVGSSRVYITPTYAWIESNVGDPHGYLTFTIYQKEEADGLSQVTVNGDSNLIASNIAEGVSIFGVTGTLNAGYTIDEIALGSISGAITGNASRIGSYAFGQCQLITNASFPEAMSIGTHAFYYCVSLTSISFPNVTTIDTSAFAHCSRIKTAIFSKVTFLESYAFDGCYSLSTISFPMLTSLRESVFALCSSLITVNFPEVTSIGGYTFYRCIKLTTASFPKAVSIGSNAFNNCSSLISVFFPSVTSISVYAFSGCTSLTTINFPEATYIGSSAFYKCTMLSNTSFPKVETLSSWAFQSCTNLTTLIFPNLVIIGSYAFYSCFKLLSLYILGSSVCSLGTTSVFYSTPISNYTTYTSGVYGSIFVPSSLYNSYISATNWKTYSSRLVSLTDAQINNVLNYGRHDP